jgi:hypothetical protein
MSHNLFNGPLAVTREQTHTQTYKHIEAKMRFLANSVAKLTVFTKYLSQNSFSPLQLATS